MFKNSRFSSAVDIAIRIYGPLLDITLLRYSFRKIDYVEDASIARDERWIVCFRSTR